MPEQRLTELFDGIAAKRLVAVEVAPEASNQHELNGIAPVLRVFGRPEGKLYIPTQFVYLDDSESGDSSPGQLTLYNARADDPKRNEYRLYYSKNPVLSKAEPGDLFILAKRRDADSAVAIVAPAGSSAELQLEWLFGLDSQLSTAFVARGSSELHESQLDISRRLVLDAIEEVVPAPAGTLVDLVVEKFGTEFPSTREFSEFARSTLPEVRAGEDPDAAIVAWMNREEELFAAFSSHLLSSQLQGLIEAAGAPPVDPSPFQELMLGHQNRSKSRAGHALENHLEAVFNALRVPYTRGHLTENRAKPDFVFPGGTEYDDSAFDTSHLTMLAAKRTLKDRWRQVLSESERIAEKHLITLQAPISENQTDEMRAHAIQLVVPASLQSAFSPDQQTWLMSVGEFVALLNRRSGRSLAEADRTSEATIEIDDQP